MVWLGVFVTCQVVAEMGDEMDRIQALFRNDEESEFVLHFPYRHLQSA